MADHEEQHRRFMREAIQLAVDKVGADGSGPFGAVLVRDNVVVGRGWNQVTTTNDPTAHAEIVALRQACREAGVFHLPGTVLYSSCEPCPMCLAAAYWARIDRIYFGATRLDAEAAGFADLLIYEEFNRPIDERRLPLIPLMRDDALETFARWRANPDRVEY